MPEKTFRDTFSDSVIPMSSGYIYLPSAVTDIFYFFSSQAKVKSPSQSYGKLSTSSISAIWQSTNPTF